MFDYSSSVSYILQLEIPLTGEIAGEMKSIFRTRLLSERSKCVGICEGSANLWAFRREFLRTLAAIEIRLSTFQQEDFTFICFTIYQSITDILPIPQHLDDR